MRQIPLIAGTISFLMATLTTDMCLATTYKWKDANGEIHYTQSPPPEGVTGEKIKAPPKVDTESAVKELKDKEAGFGSKSERRICPGKIGIALNDVRIRCHGDERHD